MRYLGNGNVYIDDEYSVLHIEENGYQKAFALKCHSVKNNSFKQKQKSEKIQNASLDSWYDVTYIQNHMDFQCPVREYQTACRRVQLRLDNMNGWGIGTVCFVTREDKLMVLHWRAIVSMIPLKS